MAAISARSLGGHAPLDGADVLFDLLGAACPRQRHAHDRIGDHPRQCQLRHREAAIAGRLLQRVHATQVLQKVLSLKQGLLEYGAAAAKVVLAEGRLGRHRAGQQAVGHRPKGHHAEPVRLAEGKELGLGPAVEQVIADLLGDDGKCLLAFAQLGGAEVAHAAVADLALLLKLGHCAHGIGDGNARVRPVNEVKVEIVGLQPLQAVLEVRGHAVRRGAALADEHDAVPPPLERPTEELFTLAESVPGGGVEQRDPKVNRSVDAANGLVVVERSVVAASNGESAESNDGRHQIGLP